MTYAVTSLFHPSHRVPDLDEARQFFQRVFGRDSFGIADYLATDDRGADPRYPTDYCIFTVIADLFMDCLDPARYVLDGVPCYQPVTTPRLSGLGWFVEGIDDLWLELRRRQIGGTDQRNIPATGDEPPLGFLSTTPIIFTVARDAGLRYEFIPPLQFPLDPRSDPNWTLPPVSDNDPLGIERCSHHTIVTDRPDRAASVLVDMLGGTVIHQQRNEVLHTDSTFVALADAVFELAVPTDAGTPAMVDLSTNSPDDTYHSITFKVVDVDRAADHLLACGVRLRARTDQIVITEPADSLGVPWGFCRELTPGDRR